MKKKTKFVVEPFDDIRIIGINTAMIDYQLAWNINKVAKMNLAKYKDISSDDEHFFSFYLYDAGENSNTFNLVALSNQDTKWVAFSPQTDYLLIIRNYIKETDFQSLLNKIKAIPRVVHAYVVDLGKNKKIDTILEDIELHEMNIFDEMNYRPKIKGES
ncbi:MAG: IPExxxVDY family protein [Bacteroidales bacterium]|nr:IPExxxVDY family protein [Bacteroidales bacterium]